MNCGLAFADYSFKPNTSGYEALRSSNYFGKINNTPLDSLKTYATPQSDYVQVFQEYTKSASYQNVISLAAWQFDAMIVQYKELKQLDENVVKEINAFKQ